MKINSITINNVGIIADTVITFDKPLLLFYGEIRQGKSTILNAVRWVCGGAFPTDIIRHGEKEAFIELGFDGGCIRREFYVSAKSKETRAREVQYVLAGKPQPNPVSKIKELLNPFLLNQDHLRNMTELERKKYFAELFAVDTTALDTELFNSDRKAVALRAEIKGYGEIDLEKVEKVDANTLKVELQKIQESANNEVRKVRSANQDVTIHNSKVDLATDRLSNTRATIQRLEKELLELNGLEKEQSAWLESNPKQTPTAEPTAPDTKELEARISNAAANNVRAEQYEKNLARDNERKGKERDLSAIEKRMRDIRDEKIAKLKDISKTCGISELAFDEEGNFTYQGTQAGMLSTSQIMKLSSELSALYPEGMGIELLDRGESLGTSIYDYIELAKREEKTVLATIVGQRPAQSPPEVGVFVVQDGHVLKDGENDTAPKKQKPAKESASKPTDQLL